MRIPAGEFVYTSHGLHTLCGNLLPISSAFGFYHTGIRTFTKEVASLAYVKMQSPHFFRIGHAGV